MALGCATAGLCHGLRPGQRPGQRAAAPCGAGSRPLANWGIGNQLHWVMHLVYHDDLMRLRIEHGPANMATTHHMALNLLRSVPVEQSLAVKRKSAGWDKEFMRCAVTQEYH